MPLKMEDEEFWVACSQAAGHHPDYLIRRSRKRMQAMHDKAMAFIREQSKSLQCFDFKQFADSSFP